MATATDLVGLGVPPQVASLEGNQPSSVTCAGTTQGTATKVYSSSVELTAAASQTGAILPTDAPIGKPFFFQCVSATSAVVYVPSGHTLNGTSNAGATIPQNKLGVLYQYKKGAWGSIVSA